MTIPGLFLLGACAVPTAYQPTDGHYGYSEQALDGKRYRVSFTGNPSTPRDAVENYLLYRAGELTVQNGYDYFRMVDRDLERSIRDEKLGYYDIFGDRYFPTQRGFRRAGRRPAYLASSTFPVINYSGDATITLFKGQKPIDDVNAYDALDVLQRLQPLILRSNS
jgi:hypothetical protein